MKKKFIVLSFLALGAFTHKQSTKIEIDWDDIWQFEEISPKLVLKKLPIKRLNNNLIKRFQGRTGRIIGGTEVSPHRLAYQAALIMDFGTPVFCGASLIKPQYVLTAAHCTSGAKSAIVILGAHNITNESEESQIRIKVSPYWILSHKLFWPHTFRNDIALIKLPEPVTLSNFIQPVGLPEFQDLNVGSECLMSGWGLIRYGDTAISDMLRYTTSQIIENSECVNTFEFVKDAYICSSGAGIKSTCSGDSGGPMVGFVDGYPIQYGIASFKYSKGCEYGKPSGFTRIASYMPWLLSHIS